MAYLDRQLSEYKTAVPFINPSPEVAAEPAAKPVPQKAPEEHKNSNHQLAKLLTDAKSGFIKALTSAPITALWLVHKYESSQNTPIELDDEASSNHNHMQQLLVELKKTFMELHQCQHNPKVHYLTQEHCRQRLTHQLENFPFTFNDLIEASEIVVQHIHSNRLWDVFCDHLTDHQQAIIRKRLASPTVNDKKLKELLRFIGTALDAYPTGFLFPQNTQLYTEFTQIVLCEKQWLHARQNLVMANNKLVSFIVNQYKGNFLDFNDLVQEGQTGLLKAVDRFDYRLGFQFSTYAGYWIRQAISRSLSRNERPVRIPCEQVANINRVFRAKDQLTGQLGKEPSVTDLANCVQMSVVDINNILAIAQTSVPLENNNDEDSEANFAPVDFLEQQVFNHPIENIAEIELTALLSDAIKMLNPREARIVCCHFGLYKDPEMTLQEIGEEMNLTRERIRQIQVIALNKIKAAYGKQLINFL